MRSFLQGQKEGLTGHPEHAGYPYSTYGWKADVMSYPLGLALAIPGGPKGPMMSNPWQLETTPLRLRLPAVRLKHWELEKSHTPIFPSPLLREEGTEEIELVPLGATTLRLTVFPDCQRHFSRF